ncbi:MAG: ACT domain-containing protein [Desulfobacterales bacterium]|nr:ACT domain-containing protein [Desulfobacterales bacterium]
MKQEFIISAVGRNVTGIVATVSKEIYNCGCNFEDSRMTLLGNHFALMILVTATTGKMCDDLAAACERLDKEKDLKVTLFPVDVPGEKRNETEPNYEIRVKGVDRMGIVYRTTQLLASLNINIVELETKIESRAKDGKPIFLMRTSVVVPREVDGEELRKDLKFLAEDLQEMISLTRLPEP